MGVILLGKIKVHEIAKEIGLTSKEIIEKANAIGIKVSSHLSAVDDEQAKKIKDSFKSKKNLMILMWKKIRKAKMKRKIQLLL